jgi:hypothetical protein
MRHWFVVLTLGTSLLCYGSILWRISDAIPYCRSIVLGDLDGDGDLDALAERQAAAQIWLNDGRGVFMDSGQRLSLATIELQPWWQVVLAILLAVVLFLSVN